MNLDDIQNNALEQLVQFGLNESNYIILSGIAGSGKTYTISNFYKLFNEVQELTKLSDSSFFPYSIVFTSTVNKAVTALKEQLVKNGISDVEPMTIFQSLGLYVKDNYRTGKSELECKNYGKLIQQLKSFKTLFIVDEYTYLDEDMVSFISNLTEDIRPFYPLKFIFVGDSNQLVNGFGKVVDTVRSTLNPPIIKLGKSKRADNFYLAKLAEDLSEHVENNSSLHIEPTNNILRVLPREEFDKELLDLAQTGDEDFTFIAYHNKVVDSYSASINEARGLGSNICAGEIYINGAQFSNDTGTVKISPESLVRVTQVDPVIPIDTYHIQEILKHKFEYKKGALFPLEDLVYALIKFGLLYGAKISTINGSYDNHSINVLLVQDRPLLKKIIASLKRLKLWQYVFYLEKSVMVLRTPYSTTVHKSQGSTYKRVFVDMKDILSVNCPYTRSRLIYVALTRASNEIVITV